MTTKRGPLGKPSNGGIRSCAVSEPELLRHIDDRGRVLVESKLGVTVYLDPQFTLAGASMALEAFLSRFEAKAEIIRATAIPTPPRTYTRSRLTELHQEVLASLARGEEAGLGVSSEGPPGSYLFMYHCFGRERGPRRASFIRCEFPLCEDPDTLRVLTHELADGIQLTSGTAGFILKAKPRNLEAHERSYALARRFLGLDLVEVDVTTKHMLTSYRCPSWLTVIGHDLRARVAASGAAIKASTYEQPCRYASIFQARPAPAILDVNGAPQCGPEGRIAEALAPIQCQDLAFPGPLWNEGNSRDWLLRFHRR